MGGLKRRATAQAFANVQHRGGRERGLETEGCNASGFVEAVSF
jgi:hypothetical protein